MEHIHYQILKNFFDELIVNQGVLKVENPEKVVEKIKLDYLIKLAFRFYAKLYSNEVIRVYKNKWDWFKCANCPDKCPVYADIMDNSREKNDSSSLCPKHNNDSASMKCINCGAVFTSKKPEKKENIINYIPLCENCDEEIGQEIEIWENLFKE